jgi:hypothetical protein
MNDELKKVRIRTQNENRLVITNLLCLVILFVASLLKFDLLTAVIITTAALLFLPQRTV